MSNLKPLELIKSKKYGRLTVIDELPPKYRIRDGRPEICRRFRCLCDCGNYKEVSIANLGHGVKSCGCLRVENGRRSAMLRIKHGMSSLAPNSTNKRTREYGIWNKMITRCTNPKSAGYHRYGGRGISVCDRWRYSFENFISDMGNSPSPKHSIERGNNNGNYEPSNCRWATQAEQVRNTSQNVFIEYDGKTLCMMDWAIITGIPYDSIGRRVRKGLSGSDLFKPIMKQNARIKRPVSPKP